MTIHPGRKCSVWYTDGSTMDKSTGEHLEYSWSLGNFSNISLTEVFSILICCRICIDRGYRGRYGHICSDSQTASLALCRYNFNSCIVWECYSLLYQLAKGNCVTLYWVPGHSDIHGNEVADELSRNGSITSFADPETAIGTSNNLIRNTVFDIFRKKQYLNWLSCKGQ